MNWTKIPTNLLISRTPDNELVAIVKYQLLWADLEYQPTDEIALRYMTNKQLTLVKHYLNNIEAQVMSDIKLTVNHRGNQKTNYQKKQSLKQNADSQCDSQCDDKSDSHTDGADKIRLDKIKNKNNVEEQYKNLSTTRAKENQIENQTANQNEKRVHNALEIFGNSFRATDAVVGVFDRPDGTTREGIQIKNPRLMAFVRHRFDKRTLEKVSDWAIDHNQRGHTYNASALLKLLCKFQSNIEPAINYNAVQSQYLTFEQAQRNEAQQ